MGDGRTDSVSGGNDARGKATCSCDDGLGTALTGRPTVASMERNTDATALTPRKREVLDLLVRRRTNSEIAERLGISIQGVKWHVTELLDRYEVSNREELIACVEAERAPRARFRRMAAGLAGLLPVKAVVGAAAVAGVGAATLAAVVSASAIRGNASDQDASPAATQAGLPPGSVSLPDAIDGAKWTPREAYDQALAVAQEAIDTRVKDGRLAPISASQLPLADIQWLDQIAQYDDPDGDRYWTPWTAPVDAWLFRWAEDNVTGGPQGAPATATLKVDVLIVDGGSEQQPSVEVVFGETPPGFGRGTFRSHAEDARTASLRDPVGPAIHVAWLNNVPGTTEYQIYPTAAGTWCYRIVALGPQPGPTPDPARGGPASGYGGGCPFGAELPDRKLSASVQYVRPDDDWHVSLAITTAPEVVRVVVTQESGQSATLETVPLPEDLKSTLRFAYISPAFEGGALTLVGLDTSGNEVTREALPRPDLGITPPANP